MGKSINEIGNKYGKLTVLEFVGKERRNLRWKCRCDCGNESVVFGNNLRNGSTKSCGKCIKRNHNNLLRKTYKSLIDEAGKRYGKLIVLEKIWTVTPKDNRHKWLCQCDCGNRVVVPGYTLRSNKQQSCGCFLKEWRTITKLPGNKSNFHFLLKQIKGNAKRRNIEYSLTDEQVKELVIKNCFYCGIEPRQIINQRRSSEPFLYNGLDRKDNNKGYCIDNVITACKKCNFAKGSMPFDEFMDWIKRISKYNFGV